MFESLNVNTLSEIANIGDRSLFKAGTRLEDLVGCIEQAILECRNAAPAPGSQGFDSQQVISGLRAAQEIMATWWAAEQNAL